MENSNIFSRLSDALLPWYARNKRDLPWRSDSEPYHVWLSEIMLQQTRVETVKDYYIRFLAECPDIASVAVADDELLHKLWEGLGYYSRVRNLKKAAIQIRDLYGGAFPEEYVKVLALPGIGPYTAGAICSIAFGQPTPAVDGNVLRVVSRLTDDNTPIDQVAYKTKVQNNLAAIYPPKAGDFTQALMELGATVCGPNRKPDCLNCPCKEFCLGFRNGTADVLPVRSPKRSRIVEEKTVFILNCGDLFALEKRSEKGLLAGLWQFPNVAGKLEIKDALCVIEQMNLKPKNIRRIVERKHIFTHIEWNLRGIYVEVLEPESHDSWFTKEQINAEAALPTAFRQFWEEIDHV